MRRFLYLAAALAMWCAPAAASVADISEQWAGYWNARNVDGVLKLYAPEPTFLPTIGRAWIGAGEIRANFADLLKLYDPHIELHSTKTATSGTLAYDSGTYDETIDRVKGGAPIVAKGSYLFLFEHEKHGGWKILEQTFTERAPVKF